MDKITQMSYQRVFNLGNYEAERIELVTSIDANDNIKEVFGWLKAEVNYLHEHKEDKANE